MWWGTSIVSLSLSQPIGALPVMHSSRLLDALKKYPDKEENDQ
jgi:hypothetical protein